MLATAFVLALTLVAAVTDLLWNKIYNWNTYGGILAALALSVTCVAAEAADPAAASRLRMWFGGLTLTESVGGLLACGLLMVVCCAFFPDIGGGDVKLLAMLGAWLGWQKGLEALLWTFVLAACFGLIGLIWKIGPLVAVGRSVRLIANKLRLVWFAPLSDDERKALKPPIFIAPSALAAVVIVEFGKAFGL